MVEKDRLLRELDSCHNRLRRSGSTGAEAGRTWQPSSSTALLLPRVQPEFQQARKEELKVIFLTLKELKSNNFSFFKFNFNQSSSGIAGGSEASPPAGRDVPGAVRYIGDRTVPNQRGGGCRQGNIQGTVV